MNAPRRRNKPLAKSKEAIIAECIEAALKAGPGSDAAIGLAQEAIFHCLSDTMKALQPALAPLLEAADLLDAAAIRKSWIGKLRFLNGCLALPDLRSLSVALQELGRGVTADALSPDGNMQGGKSNTERLRLMAYAVEAADELKRRCAKHEEYRAELKASETAYATIEKYRKAIRHIPELAPRLGWKLYWKEEPEIVLQQLVWAIRVLDKSQ